MGEWMEVLVPEELQAWVYNVRCTLVGSSGASASRIRGPFPPLSNWVSRAASWSARLTARLPLPPSWRCAWNLCGTPALAFGWISRRTTIQPRSRAPTPRPDNNRTRQEGPSLDRFASQPKNGGLHSISQRIGIELRRSVSFDVSAGLIDKPAQGILGT